MNEDDIQTLSHPNFITAKQMLVVIFTIAVVLQSI